MPIKVVTFNIHHATDIDNNDSLDKILSLLRSINPDLICLQEVDKIRPQTNRINQALYLAKNLGFRYVYEPVRKYPEGSYGNAILSRYAILNSKNIILTDLSDVRCCLKADIRAHNNIITVFNTHLGLSQPVRHKDLAEIILPELLSHNNPTILAGDFNAPTNRTEIKMLESLLTDTFTKNSGLIDHSFPANNPTARIDYIFINKQFSPLNYYIVDSDVSDHLPVVSEITAPQGT